MDDPKRSLMRLEVLGWDRAFQNTPWVAHTRRRANHCMAEHAKN